MKRESTKSLISQFKKLGRKLKKRRKLVVIEAEILISCEGQDLWGEAYKGCNVIRLLKGMDEKRRQSVLLHELLHLAVPEASEARVEKMDKLLADCMWDQGYRRVIEDKDIK